MCLPPGDPGNIYLDPNSGDTARVNGRDRNVTHDPLIGLARAIRQQQAVRILLRSFSENIPSETIEGFVLRFEGDAAKPTRVVISASPPGSPDASERVVRMDRVAMVEVLADVSVGETQARETLPAPADGSADRTVRIGALQIKRGGS